MKDIVLNLLAGSAGILVVLVFLGLVVGGIYLAAAYPWSVLGFIGLVLLWAIGEILRNWSERL